MDCLLESTAMINRGEAIAKCKRRRSRTVFTALSIGRMEEKFDQNRYPGIQERESLAAELSIPEPRIQVWFQNRRSRNKKVTCNQEGPGSTNMVAPTRDSTRDQLSQSLLKRREICTEISQQVGSSDSSPSMSPPYPLSNTDTTQQQSNQHHSDMINSYVTNVLRRDWLALQYQMTLWQGLVQSQSEQQHQEARMIEENRYHGSSVSSNSESSSGSEEDCIVERLFRFSKNRRHTQVGTPKRKHVNGNSYQVKVPRIDMTGCSPIEFDQSYYRLNSDDSMSGYSASGYDTATTNSSVSD